MWWHKRILVGKSTCVQDAMGRPGRIGRLGTNCGVPRRLECLRTLSGVSGRLYRPGTVDGCLKTLGASRTLNRRLGTVQASGDIRRVSEDAPGIWGWFLVSRDALSVLRCPGCRLRTLSPARVPGRGVSVLRRIERLGTSAVRPGTLSLRRCLGTLFWHLETVGASWDTRLVSWDATSGTL